METERKKKAKKVKRSTSKKTVGGVKSPFFRKHMLGLNIEISKFQTPILTIE